MYTLSGQVYRRNAWKKDQHQFKYHTAPVVHCQVMLLMLKEKATNMVDYMFPQQGLWLRHALYCKDGNVQIF